MISFNHNWKNLLPKLYWFLFTSSLFLLTSSLLIYTLAISLFRLILQEKRMNFSWPSQWDCLLFRPGVPLSNQPAEQFSRWKLSSVWSCLLSISIFTAISLFGRIWGSCNAQCSGDDVPCHKLRSLTICFLLLFPWKSIKV